MENNRFSIMKSVKRDTCLTRPNDLEENQLRSTNHVSPSGCIKKRAEGWHILNLAVTRIETRTYPDMYRDGYSYTTVTGKLSVYIPKGVKCKLL